MLVQRLVFGSLNQSPFDCFDYYSQPVIINNNIYDDNNILISNNIKNDNNILINNNNINN